MHLLSESNNLIELLGNMTVKYNESIIDQISSNNELKILKDTRNKLISDKSKLEIQVANERVRNVNIF